MEIVGGSKLLFRAIQYNQLYGFSYMTLIYSRPEFS